MLIEANNTTFTPQWTNSHYSLNHPNQAGAVALSVNVVLENDWFRFVRSRSVELLLNLNEDEGDRMLLWLFELMNWILMRVESDFAVDAFVLVSFDEISFVSFALPIFVVDSTWHDEKETISKRNSLATRSHFLFFNRNRFHKKRSSISGRKSKGA
jgi:hypothetical protein